MDKAVYCFCLQNKYLCIFKDVREMKWCVWNLMGWGVNCQCSKLRINHNVDQLQPLIINRFLKSLIILYHLFLTALLCLPDYMRAVVSRDYLQSQGYSAQMVTLSDHRCTPTVTPHEVIFNIPYNGCGTIREVRSLLCIGNCKIWFKKSRERDIVVHSAKKWTNETWGF